jgi:adenylate cyclase
MHPFNWGLNLQFYSGLNETMQNKFDYTKYRRRFAIKFPVFDYLLWQVYLWVLAYGLLAILAYLVLLSGDAEVQSQLNLKAIMIIALFFGVFNGIAAGYANWIFERKVFHSKSIGIIMLSKAVICLIVFIILISVVRSVLYPYLLTRFFDKTNPVTSQLSWDAFFYLLLIYTVVIGLLISFINQANKKYGPGVLLPLLLGKYRKPKEEERFFLFMDLKSSTSIAETMGHLRYSSFIRDSFMDINTVLAGYNAQIYQYAGDEIIITWTVEEGLKDFSCIQFFFACEERFNKRSAHYQKKYGQIPQFKAGLHMGKVTVVEVGDIKRDIAYHGDTLNTASRIQSVCNFYHKNFLTSVYIWEKTGLEKQFATEFIGEVELKGKTHRVEIASIQRLKAA